MACGLPHLTHRRDFVRVSRRGRSAAMPGMVVQACARDGLRRSGPGDALADGGRIMRLGITASRKVGSAVVRNRAKRRLRAAAKAVLPARGTPGYDYVLIARSVTPTRPFVELTRDLVRALGRLGLDRCAMATPGAGTAGTGTPS